MKALKQLIFGKAAKGEKIEWQYVCFKTTYPDTTLPYNQWQNYIHKQLN
jgi:hypothetical protein